MGRVLSLTSLEDLLRATISAFRADPPDGYSFTNLTDFSNPTQVYGVELTIDSTRYASLLIVHDPHVQDGVVEVVSVDGADGLASLAEDANTRFRFRPLPPQYRLPWSVPEHTAIESMLLQANALRPLQREVQPGDVLVARQQVLQTEPPGSLIGLLLPPVELPAADRLLRGLGTERPTSTTQQVDPSSLPEVVRTTARAIHTFPPVWFGSPPFPSVADHIRGRTLQDALFQGKDEVVALGEVSGIPTLLTRRGLVVCLSADDSLSLATLNTVLAVLARSGIPQEAASADDLIEVTNFREDDPPGDHRSALTPRNRSRGLFVPAARAPGLDSWFHVSEGAAEIILLSAAETARSPYLGGRALRLFDAQTLAQRNHHTEAFIVSWSLVEDWIARAFEQFWRARGRSNRRIRDDAPVWTAKQRLDLLVAAQSIDDERSDLLDRLRKKRNAIVHRLEKASAADADECLSAAGSLLELPTVDLVGAGVFHV